MPGRSFLRPLPCARASRRIARWSATARGHRRIPLPQGTTCGLDETRESRGIRGRVSMTAQSAHDPAHTRRQEPALPAARSARSRVGCSNSSSIGRSPLGAGASGGSAASSRFTRSRRSASASSASTKMASNRRPVPAPRWGNRAGPWERCRCGALVNLRWGRSRRGRRWRRQARPGASGAVWRMLPFRNTPRRWRTAWKYDRQGRRRHHVIEREGGRDGAARALRSQVGVSADPCTKVTGARSCRRSR